MNYLKYILPIFIVLLFLVISKKTQAQKFYYFENVKTGKSYRMHNQNLVFKIEVYNTDTAITKIYKEINCRIDSFSEDKLYTKNAIERIEIYFTNGYIKKTENRCTKKGRSATFSLRDSINISEIIEINDYSGFDDRYKLLRVFNQVVGLSLGLVTLVGPFVFNDYFKVVGISFVSWIPIFATSAILENKYLLNGNRSGKKTKWKLVYK
ncbi:MAG: hypothetical protein ACEQSR_03085 [Candidatus Methylacidiphilales bacterium]